MQKLFGIILVVGLIWVGVTVFTEGTQGVLKWLPWVSEPGPAEPAPIDRLRSKGEAARDQQMNRIERQLGREPDEEP